MNENAVEKVTSWTVEEGTFEGTLLLADEYTQHNSSGEQQYFRLVFTIDSKESEYYEYRAQKRYLLKDGYPRELMADLERWLGKEFFAQNPSLQWQDLIGIKARVTIKHLHTEGYDKPFVYINRIQPVKKAARKIVAVPKINFDECPQQEAA